MSFIFSKKINRHEAPIGVLIFEAILFSLISGILLLFPRITDSFWLLHLTSINETVVIVVGLIGIVVNVGASLLFMRGAHDDINIKGAFIHLLADALILVGVVLSAIIIRYTQWLWIDPIVGLFIVAIILWGTWGLLRDSVNLLLDAVPRYIDHAGVKQYLEHYPGVTAVHDLHIWGLSTREVALTAHLVMPTGTLTDADYKK